MDKWQRGDQLWRNRKPCSASGEEKGDDAGRHGRVVRSIAVCFQFNDFVVVKRSHNEIQKHLTRLLAENARDYGTQPGTILFLRLRGRQY